MEYISYNVGTRDFPDIYARALGLAALGLGHIYQANPSCPCYNYYIYISLHCFLMHCLGPTEWTHETVATYGMGNL